MAPDHHHHHDKAGPTPLAFHHTILGMRRYRSVLVAAVLALFVLTGLYTMTNTDARGWTTMTAPSIVGGGIGAPAAGGAVSKEAPKGDVVYELTKSLIPPKIWQVMLPKKDAELSDVNPENLRETNSWLAMNVDYQYQLVGPHMGDAFVEKHFGDNPRILNAYKDLTNVGMKPDFLRHLLLSVYGGTYTDLDTRALRPINSWIPRSLRSRIRLVVGIEFDRRDGPMWADIVHELQFATWTVAAAPGHPVFTRMLDRILESLDQLSASHGGVPAGDVVPTSLEVMNTTGPAAWTDAVFEQLQAFDPSLRTVRDLAFMEKHRVIGDVLVLSINGFGMGQAHSGSSNTEGEIPREALMKHMFWGSWREKAPGANADRTGGRNGNNGGDPYDDDFEEGSPLKKDAEGRDVNVEERLLTAPRAS